MEKKTTQKLGKLLKEFNEVKERIQKDKDRLRDLYSEIENIAQSVQEGLDCFDEGLLALNRISRFI